MSINVKNDFYTFLLELKLWPLSPFAPIVSLGPYWIDRASHMVSCSWSSVCSGRVRVQLVLCHCLQDFPSLLWQDPFSSFPLPLQHTHQWRTGLTSEWNNGVGMNFKCFAALLEWVLSHWNKIRFQSKLWVMSDQTEYNFRNNQKTIFKNACLHSRGDRLFQETHS